MLPAYYRFGLHCEGVVWVVSQGYSYVTLSVIWLSFYSTLYDSIETGSQKSLCLMSACFMEEASLWDDIVKIHKDTDDANQICCYHARRRY